jgi:multicomponent Na+:H+ antiporter subunit C
VEQHQIYAIVAAVVFALGFHGLLARGHMLRKIIAVNVMSSGVFLLLISIARRDAREFPDPVPQAMALTGIVVAISISALAMALARGIYRQTGRTRLGGAGQKPPLLEKAPEE